ncbi:MAG: tRNA epoxyqueuosine(34) reductase QueG [Elusimicrobiota bacterium]
MAPPEPAPGLSAALRERAHALGADHVGIAPAVPPPLERGGPEAYLAWIAKGLHGEMGYMARSPEDRSDITRWFPPARSVVVAAFSYPGLNALPKEPGHGCPPGSNQYPGLDAFPDRPGAGRIARYALPPDYHDELKGRMKRLLEWYVENAPPPRERSTGQGPSSRAKATPRGKVFSDTSPVLERLYARCAGVGWVGKNTMIVSRRVGSFFLLAGLAVDRELAYDQPVGDRCGSCDRCLKACPTGALRGPRVLDASRCVSYLTIEKRRGSIPEKLRAGHGAWIFGCDVCQEVCPWNRFSPRTPALAARLPATADLEALAGLTAEEFRERFRGTPLHRTGHPALLRNALLGMGNSGDPRHRPTLERFSGHEDPVLAEQARWSLKKTRI